MCCCRLQDDFEFLPPLKNRPPIIPFIISPCNASESAQRMRIFDTLDFNKRFTGFVEDGESNNKEK